MLYTNRILLLAKKSSRRINYAGGTFMRILNVKTLCLINLPGDIVTIEQFDMLNSCTAEDLFN